MDITLYRDKNLMKNLLNKFSTENTPIILYGAGLCGTQYLDILKKQNISVNCFWDDDEKKQGLYLDGVIIKKPETLENFKGRVLISSFGPEKIYKKIEKHNPSLLEYVIASDFYLWEDGMDYYDYYDKNNEAIQEVYGDLSDEKSKKVMRNLLQYKISRDTSLIEEIRDSAEFQYFDSDIIKFDKNEDFLDLGAYIGDTIQVFVKKVHNKYNSITALEPDENTFLKLTNVVSSMKNVNLYKCGIGANDGVAHFQADSFWTSAVSESGNTTIEIRSIDSLLKEKRVSFLKADIEGMEKEMLVGAEKMIKNWKPKMAICIYHRKDDIFKIPLMLKKMNPSYKLYMRHYADIPVESVLYAIE